MNTEVDIARPGFKLEVLMLASCVILSKLL